MGLSQTLGISAWHFGNALVPYLQHLQLKGLFTASCCCCSPRDNCMFFESWFEMISFRRCALSPSSLSLVWLSFCHAKGAWGNCVSDYKIISYQVSKNLQPSLGRTHWGNKKTAWCRVASSFLNTANMAPGCCKCSVQKYPSTTRLHWMSLASLLPNHHCEAPAFILGGMFHREFFF